MLYLSVIFVILVAAGWLFLRTPRPEVPPLVIEKDNPALIAATNLARQTLDEFKGYLALSPGQCSVKVPFETSSGEQEFLWAEVLGYEKDELEVFLITPPVTHSGTVDRKRKYGIYEIEDWIFTTADGKKRGGFTMKAMFNIYKERFGALPEKLKDEERRYE